MKLSDNISKVIENKDRLHDYVFMPDIKFISDEGFRDEIIMVLGNADEYKYRVDKAIEEYEKNPYARLLFTGGIGYYPDNSPEKDIPEAIRMYEYALSRNIDPSDILVEPDSRTTVENFAYSRDFLWGNNVNYESIVLVTSDYHLRRSYLGLCYFFLGAHQAVGSLYPDFNKNNAFDTLENHQTVISEARKIRMCAQLYK